ncbi:alpha/beta hydrolase [Kutzneria sp. NPDC052558]|uniref:alpha/beta hydrolase n=1 Tax=Kutzneria sp. NPDC052558 TaxID=3364121 RepID=UPI0037C7DD67
MRVKVIMAAAVLSLATAAPAHAAPTCADVDTPVTAGVIHGRYCASADPGDRPLQILIPGITYTNAYFDFPGFGGLYSYASYMNARGYDTLAIDRLGIGRSTRPALGVAVNAFSNAEAVHQVVEAVRAGGVGGVGGRHYAKIVLTGHSYGTFVADLTSATYHDVDGVIGTGWFQQPSVLGLAGVTAVLWPAAADPRFLGKILDPTYVTTRVGARNFFYHPENADPAVIAADESTKDTASLSETTYLIPEATGLTTRIGVPTLRVLGQYDNVICNPTPCTESGLEQQVPALFPAGAQVHVQPNAGHDIALERNNTDGFEAQLSWLREEFQ